MDSFISFETLFSKNGILLLTKLLKKAGLLGESALNTTRRCIRSQKIENICIGEDHGYLLCFYMQLNNIPPAEKMDDIVHTDPEDVSGIVNKIILITLGRCIGARRTQALQGKGCSWRERNIRHCSCLQIKNVSKNHFTW